MTLTANGQTWDDTNNDWDVTTEPDFSTRLISAEEAEELSEFVDALLAI